MANHEQAPGSNSPESDASNEAGFSTETKDAVRAYQGYKTQREDAVAKNQRKRIETTDRFISDYEERFANEGIDVDAVQAEIHLDEENEFLKLNDELNELRDRIAAKEAVDIKISDDHKSLDAKVKAVQVNADTLRSRGVDVDELLAAHAAAQQADQEANPEPGTELATTDSDTSFDDQETTETDPTAKQKYEIMRSQEAQDAFMRGGEVAYIQYVEDEFARINGETQEDAGETAPTPGTDVEPFVPATTDEERSPEPGTEVAVAETQPVGELEPFVPADNDENEPTDDEEEEEDESPEARTIRELRETFSQASDRYADLTARDRQSYKGRYTRDPRSNTGKILRLIPGMTKLVDKMNTKQGAEIDEARSFYEQSMASLLDFAAKQYEVAGLTEQQILHNRASLGMRYDSDFEDSVADKRAEKSKPAGKITNWWVKQEGFKGKLKKGAAVLALGAVVGASSAVVLPGAVAGLVAGAAGGYLAHQITKRRANATFTQENGDKITLAQKQAEEDKSEKASMVNDYQARVSDGSEQAVLDSNAFTEITETRSDKEAFENRSRLRKAFTIAKLGGVASGLLVDGANIFESKASAAPSEPEAPAAEAPVPEVPSPEAPAPVEAPLNGESFTVEGGSGLTNELTQFANMNGHNLSPTQAYELHQHLMSKFGADYIDINGGGSDVYSQGGDVRLSAPGSAQWSNGVPNEIKNWMSGKGLW